MNKSQKLKFFALLALGMSGCVNQQDSAPANVSEYRDTLVVLSVWNQGGSCNISSKVCFIKFWRLVKVHQ